MKKYVNIEDRVLLKYICSETETSTVLGQGEHILMLGSYSTFPGLEKDIIGKQEGDSGKVVLEEDEAFGKRFPDFSKLQIPKSLLPVEMDVTGGDLLAIELDFGPVYVTVVEVQPENIVVDANYHFAGRGITIEYKILKVLNPGEIGVDED